MSDALAKISVIPFNRKEEDYDMQIVKNSVLVKAKGWSKAMSDLFISGTDKAKLK